MKKNKIIKKNNKGITQSDLEDFIKALDQDPHCKNTRCCDGEGICVSESSLKK